MELHTGSRVSTKSLQFQNLLYLELLTRTKIADGLYHGETDSGLMNVAQQGALVKEPD